MRFPGINSPPSCVRGPAGLQASGLPTEVNSPERMIRTSDRGGLSLDQLRRLDARLHRDPRRLRLLRPGGHYGEDPVFKGCGDLVRFDLSRQTYLSVYRVEVPFSPDVRAASDLVFWADPTDCQNVLVEGDLDVLGLEPGYGRFDFEPLV